MQADELQPSYVQRATARLLARGALLVLICSLAGCPSGVRPPQQPDVQTAEKLARQGDHRQAATMYDRLAAQASGSQQIQLRLRAAEEWLISGEYAQAQRALDALGPTLDPEQARTRTLFAAQIAIVTGQAERALQLLRDLPVANNPTLAAQVLALQARAQFTLGRAADGARALIAREQWLRDGSQVAANRRELAESLRLAAAHGASLKPPPGADAVLAGWLELGSVLLELDRNPFSARDNVRDWRARHPIHPANSGILDDLLRESAVALEYPAQIALLLPLSGRQQAAGVAVRDGFLSAYYQQEPAQRPRVRIYDVTGQDVPSSYLRAIDEGAQFIVGPLTKDDVSAAADIADGRVPVLALNFLGEGRNAPKGFYQFALSPEDEARQVARRVMDDGHPRGVALVPAGEWGTRVLSAFADELGVLGGQIIAQGVYDPAQSDYSSVIQQLLRLSDSRERHARISGTLGVKLEFEPRRRGDVGFIFIAGQPAQGRLIRPQLRFHYAGDIPTYATSEAFEPDEVANVDMDGVMFPDMPWMISGDAVSTQLRETVQQAWPSRATRRGRLYAFGFDAYRLIAIVRSRGSDSGLAVSGMTGRLSIDSQGKVRRDLDWAEIRDGKPRELALASEPPRPKS
jgi:outer membrane PBP1 activator LpoA protein